MLSLIFYLRMSSPRFRDWLFFTLAAGALYSAGLMLPILTIPLMLCFSLPSAFLAAEYGASCAASSAVCSAAFIGSAVSAPMGSMYFLTFGLPGTVIGLIAKKGAKPGDALLASATAELLGKMAGVLALYLLYHVNAFSPAAADIEKSIAAYGVPTVNREALREVIDRVVLLMPCAFIIFSAAEAFSCLMLLSYMRRRRGGEALFSPPPFREWRFPRSVLFAMLAGIVFRYAAESQDGLYLARQMGANLSELSKGIFALQGLSCAYFFMERAKIPKAARVAAVIFALALPLMWSVLSVIGVADMGFNFRENKEGAR